MAKRLIGMAQPRINQRRLLAPAHGVLIGAQRAAIASLGGEAKPQFGIDPPVVGAHFH